MRMIAFILSFICGIAQAETIHVAVASNFASPAKEIAKLFEESSGHEVILSFGSSGKLYAQIVNGAPFDVFLSADVEKPAKLFEAGLSGEPFTYAVGSIAILVMRDEKRNFREILELLREGEFKQLAIANPTHAPYGQAAMEALASNDIKIDEDKLVVGENISQVFQFVTTGNVEYAIVAQTQIWTLADSIIWTAYSFRSDNYSPIKQDAVVIKTTETSRAFADFLKSAPIHEFIDQAGYEVPK